MRVTPLLVVTGLTLLTAGGAHAQSPSGALSPAVRATGAGLQADVAHGLEILAEAEIPLSIEDRAMRGCLIDRFQGTAEGLGSAPTPGDPWLRRIVDAYRAYWRDAMMDQTVRADAEARLLQLLNEALDLAAQDMDAVEEPLRARIKGLGFGSLHGRTGVLRELLLWRTQTESLHTVPLPEGDHRVRVVLLDDFISLGWADYATCGRRGAGGWATTDALFGVVPRYRSLEGEEFQVTFLGHEAQHFADLSRYGGLEDWELEYRAKLVELARVDQTRDKVLGKFIEDQSEDPSRPHGFANRRLLQHLTDRLGLASPADLFTVDLARLNAAAVELLIADSRQRQPRP